MAMNKNERLRLEKLMNGLVREHKCVEVRGAAKDDEKEAQLINIDNGGGGGDDDYSNHHD